MNLTIFTKNSNLSSAQSQHVYFLLRIPLYKSWLNCELKYKYYLAKQTLAAKLLLPQPLKTDLLFEKPDATAVRDLLKIAEFMFVLLISLSLKVSRFSIVASPLPLVLESEMNFNRLEINIK